MSSPLTASNREPASDPGVPDGSPAGGFEIGTPAQFEWLGTIVKTVVVLNLIDALMTLWWVRTGFATEANPLMREVLDDHAVAFVVCKLLLVSLGTLLLWWRRDRPLAVIGIFTIFLAYYGILLFHVGFASHLLAQLY